MNSLLAKSRAGFYTAAAAVLTFAATPVMAADLKGTALSNMNETSGAAGIGSTATPLPKLVGNVINALLAMIGVILVVLIIYAGFLWMTAQGNEEKVKKAKAILSNAVVGMILIFAAYSIANFVITNLVTATTQA